MKKIILVGRVGCGKTTLTQALRGKKITYHKTQYVYFHDVVIDTPGEYAENKTMAHALALYSYEANVIGLLLSSMEPYSLYPPNITPLANREVIGIVTQCNRIGGDPKRAEAWLRLAGCRNIFFVDALTGVGVDALLEYLGAAEELSPAADSLSNVREGV